MSPTAARLREVMVMIVGVQLSIVGVFFGQLLLVFSGAVLTLLTFLYELSRWLGFR